MRCPSIAKLLVCLFLAAGFACPTAMAVEIPEGLETNLESGDFSENEYVALKTVLVDSWWNSEQEEEKGIVALLLDYREPDYEDEPRERITIAFGVRDPKQKKFISKVMGGVVEASGPFVFKWDMRDEDGNKVPDGIYQVLMNITGEHYGDLVKAAIFPLYVTSGGPTLKDEGISSRRATLEFGGAPEIRFTTSNINMVTVVDFDDDGNEFNTWESVIGPGNHTLKSDLMNKDSGPLKPGKYGSRVTVDNPFGPEKEFVVRYTLDEPEPLEVSIKMKAPNQLQVDESTAIPYTVTINQNANVTLQHLSDGGAKHFIGKSNTKKPEFLLAKGTHEATWNRRPSADSTSHYNKGSHWLRITATSLTGEKKVVDTHKVTLSAKPEVPRRPPNITLELSPDHVVIGGRMQTQILYSLDMDARVRLALYDSSSGKLLKDLVYRNAKKGRYSMDLGVGNLDEGNYRIELTVQNNYGTRQLKKILSVGWRR